MTPDKPLPNEPLPNEPLPAKPLPAMTAVIQDCPATAVPAGATIVLRRGTILDVVQALGGSVTVRTPSGTLARVTGPSIAAVGLSEDLADDGTAGSGSGASSTGTGTERHVSIAGTQFSMDQVTEALRTVYDPEIPIDIVELGLIYRCEEEATAAGRKISIDLSMTSPGCGMGDVLKGDAERVVSRIPAVDEVEVTLVLDPPWSFERLSDAARLQLGIL